MDVDDDKIEQNLFEHFLDHFVRNDLIFHRFFGGQRTKEFPLKLKIDRLKTCARVSVDESNSLQVVTSWHCLSILR